VLNNPDMQSNVYNIGNDNETYIDDVAKLIIKVTGSSSELKFMPPLKEGDMRRRLPDISKMHKLLNRPLLPLEDGIKNILKDTSFII